MKLLLATGCLLFACPGRGATEELSLAQLLGGRHDYMPALFTGQVTDVLDDKTDPAYVFFSVRQGDGSLLVPLKNASEHYAELRRLIGATVCFSGQCDSTALEFRRHTGRRFEATGYDQLRVISPAPDLFDAPDILALDTCRPEEIALSPRHRTAGRVLAVWNGDSVLLQTPSNRLVRLALADAEPPRFGENVEAVGFPETDLYHINLVRARWRTAELPEPPAETARAMTFRELMEDESGRQVFQKSLYGRTLRLAGRIKDLPRNGILLIEDGGHVVPVDVSALGDRLPDGLAENGRLEVTGAYIMDVDNWRPHAPFPRIRGISIVTRTPDDLRILAHPPWWTVGKLLAVIAGLLAALLGVFAWNQILRRLADRRGRELFREQVAHVSANLRTEERTRLAIELHDSLSQCLTGIALELKAAETAATSDLKTALGHLSIAVRSLGSCHAELRNCLWDLRHGTLEDLDLNDAIRRTLRPQVGDVDLAVRFSVPRRMLTDNTAYAILKIVRELAVNAVRHGHATVIRVAGAIDGRRILFSVTDNGGGFDPKRAPGPAEGHYGLLGITERIESFGGEMRIDSAPGRGARVVVTLSAPQQKEPFSA